MSRVEHIWILLPQVDYNVEEGVNKAVQIVHSFIITLFHLLFTLHPPACSWAASWNNEVPVARTDKKILCKTM